MDSYHLTVLKIEGIKEVSNSYLYVYLGQNILRVITLEHFDINPIPILKGTLRLVIEDSQTSGQIASLSFESGIFKRLGYHWLPLFLSEEKCLKEVPEEVGLPRILIDIQAHILSPVQELTEDSDTTEENKDQLSSFDGDQNWIRRSSRGLEILEIDENMKTDEIVEFDQILELKLQVTHLTQKQEDFGEAFKNLEGQVVERDKEIAELKVKLGEEQVRVEELQKSCKSLELILNDFQNKYHKVMIQIGEKENELAGLRMKGSKELKLEMSRQENFDVKPRCVFNTADLVEAQNRLSKKLFDAEIRINSFKLIALEEIDQKVRNYLRLKKLEKFASITNELTYNISNKRVIIFTKGDVLYCKFDGSVKKFDYFVKNHFLQDVEKFKKSKCSVSSHKFLPTFSTLDKSVSSTSHTFYSTSRPKSTEKKSLKSEASCKRQAFSPVSRVTRHN